MSDFAHRFSGHAATYAAYRPTYPAALYEWLTAIAPGGIFAAFAYVHSSETPALDAVTRHYHDVTVWEHWAPEHHIIRDGYRSLDLPIDEIEAPALEIRTAMTLEQYAGFFRSWSSTQRLLKAGGEAAVRGFERALAEAWGLADAVHEISWPMFARAGTLR